ncbi:hypothetical protein BD779DRAFT_1564802 [Infundibulicybe gibba]|nr:hypothetical protein BD779DRAFT_1564802 [Infundibulicybe gibba]
MTGRLSSSQSLLISRPLTAGGRGRVMGSRNNKSFRPRLRPSSPAHAPLRRQQRYGQCRREKQAPRAQGE